MGYIFRQQVTRPVPAGAEVITRSGVRQARWRVRGKLRTADVRPNAAGADRIVSESRTWSARFRDAAGNLVTRSTGCRDRQAAEQTLARWEREVEQVRAGVLNPSDLDTARHSSTPLADHLAAYEESLYAAEVSDTYRANVLRAVRRVAEDCGVETVAGLTRGTVERWLADRIRDGMGARTRNYYRASVIAFANWCRDAGRLRGHDLDRLPKADEHADPKRQRRALTEAELLRLLSVAAERPLLDARTVRRGADKGQATRTLDPKVTDRLIALGRERVLIYKRRFQRVTPRSAACTGTSAFPWAVGHAGPSAGCRSV